MRLGSEPAVADALGIEHDVQQLGVIGEIRPVLARGGRTERNAPEIVVEGDGRLPLVEVKNWAGVPLEEMRIVNAPSRVCCSQLSFDLGQLKVMHRGRKIVRA